MVSVPKTPKESEEAKAFAFTSTISKSTENDSHAYYGVDGRDVVSDVVAIIGYGVAGVNVAISLRRSGYKGRIVAFSDTEILPYSPMLTSYYVGGEKTWDQCFPWSKEELDELDVEVCGGSPVVKLDPIEHLVVNERGDGCRYSKCVIAIGAKPATFGFPQVEGYDPLVLRTMDDAQKMKEAFERSTCKRVLVSGASMIALKSVEAALNLGLDVSLVGMNEHILDFSALPETAIRFEKGLAQKGLKMRFGQTMASVEIIENALGRELEVRFSGGDVERYDEIVVAHGVRSNLSFIEDGTIEIDRAIVVDSFMRTSNQDVYAAGDVAQALDLISAQNRVIGIWKTAALQGQCAGAAIAAEMAGETPSKDIAYKGAFIANTIAVNGTLFISAGVPQASEGQEVEIREDETMTVACIFDFGPDGNKRLVGYNVASDIDDPGGLAYDTAAMFSLRIEAGFKAG